MITKKEFIQLFESINFPSLKLNSGIYEYEIAKKAPNITLGISYETIDNENIYIFNLFLDGEYINIYGGYINPYDVVGVLVEEYNNLL